MNNHCSPAGVKGAGATWPAGALGGAAGAGESPAPRQSVVRLAISADLEFEPHGNLSGRVKSPHTE